MSRFQSLEGHNVRLKLTGDAASTGGVLVAFSDEGVMLEIGSTLPTKRVFFPMHRILEMEDCGRAPR